MKKMNSELKAKWLKALRGGRYKQGTGGLKLVGYQSKQASYCCLGVLCNLIHPKGWDKINGIKGWAPPKKADEAGEECDGSLNEAVLKYVGLSKSVQDRLIHMNDVRRNNFEEIADFVEKAL